MQSKTEKNAEKNRTEWEPWEKNFLLSLIFITDVKNFSHKL